MNTYNHIHSLHTIKMSLLEYKRSDQPIGQPMGRPFDTISDDELCKIMQFVNQEDLVCNMTATCKKMKNCIYTRADAWNKCLVIVGGKAIPSMRYLRQLPWHNVRSVYLNVLETDKWFSAFKKKHMRLDYLNIRHRISAGSLEILSQLDVKDVCANNNDMGYEDFRRCKIRRLRVNRLDDSSINALLESDMEQLDITKELVLLKDYIDKIKPTLKSFRVHDLDSLYDLTPDVFTAMYSTSLIELTIKNDVHVLITDQHLMDIAKCRTLKILEISPTNVTDSSIVQLPNLTVLSIGGSRIRRDGILHLSKMSLIRLSLSHATELTDNDIEPLIDLAPTLLYLNLDREHFLFLKQVKQQVRPLI